MRYLKTIIFVLLFLTLSKSSFSQNYNINIVPVRVFYDAEKQPLSNKNYGIEFYLLYKFVEIERRLNERTSLNFGMAFSRTKYESFMSSYRDLFYKLQPSVRFYLNKNKIISGFYLGSGFNYSRYSFISKGRFSSTDESVLEYSNFKNYISWNSHIGYKLCVFKDRFSIDLKLNEEINIFNKQKTYKINADNSVEQRSFSFPNKGLDYPFLDLKLGYRFGFKK